MGFELYLVQIDGNLIFVPYLIQKNALLVAGNFIRQTEKKHIVE